MEETVGVEFEEPPFVCDPLPPFVVCEPLLVFEPQPAKMNTTISTKVQDTIFIMSPIEILAGSERFQWGVNAEC
jgi:hypothetical protein